MLYIAKEYKDNHFTGKQFYFSKDEDLKNFLKKNNHHQSIIYRGEVIDPNSDWHLRITKENSL